MHRRSLSRDFSDSNDSTRISLPGGVTLTLSPTNPDQSKQTTYSITNFHGDTAMTAASDGTPTSSIFLYEPFGSPSSSVTFGTNSNPTNATDTSMGWAANPTRKVEGTFTLAIIQMGARVYIPSLGRFLQTDPIPGGTPNSYVYPGDPVNGNDYSGLLTIVMTWSMSGSIQGSNIQPQRTVSLVALAVLRAPIAVPRTAATVSRSMAKLAGRKAASKPYSGGANLPIGSNGRVDFRKLGPDPRYTTPNPGNGNGYVNIGAQAGFFIGFGVGVKSGENGVHPYASLCATTPGFGLTLTSSPSNATTGWSNDNSLGGFGLSGSISSDGSWEYGLGARTPGASICGTYTW